MFCFYAHSISLQSIGRPIILLLTLVEKHRAVHCHRCSQWWEEKNPLGNQRWPQLFDGKKKGSESHTRACTYTNTYNGQINQISYVNSNDRKSKRSETKWIEMEWNAQKSAAATDKLIFETKISGSRLSEAIKSEHISQIDLDKRRLSWKEKKKNSNRHKHINIHIIDIQTTGFNCSTAVAQNRVFKFKFMPRALFSLKFCTFPICSTKTKKNQNRNKTKGKKRIRCWLTNCREIQQYHQRQQPIFNLLSMLSKVITTLV